MHIILCLLCIFLCTNFPCWIFFSFMILGKRGGDFRRKSYFGSILKIDANLLQLILSYSGFKIKLRFSLGGFKIKFKAYMSFFFSILYICISMHLIMKCSYVIYFLTFSMLYINTDF